MMESQMIEALRRVEERFAELEHQLSQPDVARDPRKLRDLSKERSRLDLTVKKSAEYKGIEKVILEDEQAIASGDAELAELAAAELPELREKSAKLAEELKKLLLPRDPDDDKNVICEIRAGTGGDEATLFAAELVRMYTKYAESRGWKQEMMSLSENEAGGYKEAIFSLVGESVYREMKFESGVHRVQRVPATEGSGRIHTSACTVAVMPEAVDAGEIDINPADLRIDTFRASGAGGQHINKTDSAVRITHVPTNIVVQCQNDRSQHKNKAEAMSMLKARLYEAELRKRQAEQQKLEDSKSDIGWGHQIRSYVLDQSRIKDLRTNYEVGNTQAVLDGDLDGFIEASLKQGV